MDFSGKVCVITGGANGIGRCMVEEFAKSGAWVAFSDTDTQAGETLAETIGKRAFFAPGDMAEKRDVELFAQKVKIRFQKVDAIINNACVSKGGIRSGCGWEDFDYVLRLGVTAPYYLTMRFQDVFSEGACVINIASTRAFMSQPDTESYTAAKGGILSLTHALSVSLSGRVRVNSISPGWIDTGAYHAGEYHPRYHSADEKQHPAGRIGHPMDIARMAMYLCSPDASFITGENIVVDGGMTRVMIYHGDGGWTLDPQNDS